MKTQKLISWIIFLSLCLLPACAPSATPTMIASEPQQSYVPRPQPTQALAYPEEAESSGAPQPQGNTFQDYGVNPEEDTRKDHLSTFGLDVDTASYSVTRSYIEQGNLPPYDAVRVEEFVNSFDQGYSAPQEAAFAIYADGAPAPQGFDEDTYLLRFGIQGYKVDDSERKPAVLTFVIDVSGSMNMENRLELVKRSLRLLVNRLDERDSVAIVVYGSNARAVLRPTSGSEHKTIINAIERLNPEDSTNAEAGLRLGYRYAQEAYREGAINRVILCSDGVANTGVTDSQTILSEVQRYVDNGITLTAVGVGMGNFNDVLLEQLADRGNGFYAYVDSPEEARKLFVDNLTSSLQVIAQDAKVQVDFNSEVVESYRLLGYENREIADRDFRDDSVDAGELGAGHTATAIYAVKINPGAEGRIATVQLRWKDPDNGEVHEINGNFNTWGLTNRFEDSDPRFQLSATVAQFAEILRESPYIHDLSLYDLARQADRVTGQMEQDEQARELTDLIYRASEIRR